jgi:serine/threonine protein kinase
MSTEQEVAGSYLRPSSDVYSLGLILFEMLTNRGYKNLRPGTRLKSLSPDSPVWLDDLLARMLSDDPKARPWDGKEALEELNRLHDTQPQVLAPAAEVNAPGAGISKASNLRPAASEPSTRPTVSLQTEEPTSLKYLFFNLKNQILNYSYSKNTKLAILTLSMIILISSMIIVVALVWPKASTNDVKRDTSASASQPQNTIAASTAVQFDAKTTILGKWVVTEAVDDPVEQGPSWQHAGNTMEFFTDGNQEFTYDGMRSGTPYRVEGDIVYFTFQDGRSDGWKVAFFNSGNSMLLSAIKTTERMTLNRE